MPYFHTPSDYSLHYELHGDGPEKVLLVMGFGCCKTYWHPFVDRLMQCGREDHDARTNGPDSGTGSPSNPSPAVTASSLPPASTSSSSRYTVCTFDTRGFGRSGDSFHRYSSSSLARDSLGLLMHLQWVKPEREWIARDIERQSVRRQEFESKLGEKSGENYRYAPPPLHIAGWSMGGMVTTELMLQLTSWSTERAKAGEWVADLRSVVIASSSRGGITHRGEKHDADPIVLADAADAEADMAAARSPLSFLSPFSLVRRLRARWFRSRVGRWGWGRTFLLRNVPPPGGLYRIFRLLIFSLTVARIDQVLELHYSTTFLQQPYIETDDEAERNGEGRMTKEKTKSRGPLSVDAVCNMPQAAAAITSAARPALQVSQDVMTGEYRWQQTEEADMEDDEDEDDDDDHDVMDVDDMEDVQNGEAAEYLTGINSSEQDDATASAPASPIRPSLTRRVSFSDTRSPSTTHTSPSPAPSPLSCCSSASSSPSRVLTQREYLASQYMSRAPFDRFIFLYLYALMGHALVCLTHHVSRKRIREFVKLQESRRKAWRYAEKNGLLPSTTPSVSNSLAPVLLRPIRVLVITGAADVLVHPANSYHLSEQFCCPLLVLDRVGHMLHVEQPTVFAQLVHSHFMNREFDEKLFRYKQQQVAHLHRHARRPSLSMTDRCESPTCMAANRQASPSPSASPPPSLSFTPLPASRSLSSTSLSPSSDAGISLPPPFSSSQLPFNGDAQPSTTPHSRQLSYLVHIRHHGSDEETGQGQITRDATAHDSDDGVSLARAGSTRSLASGRRGSRTSIMSTTSTSSLHRRVSFKDGAAATSSSSSSRHHVSCLHRCIKRVTSLPGTVLDRTFTAMQHAAKCVMSKIMGEQRTQQLLTNLSSKQRLRPRQWLPTLTGRA